MRKPDFVDSNMFCLAYERGVRELSRGEVSSATGVDVGRLREFEDMMLDPTQDEYNRLAEYFCWEVWK